MENLKEVALILLAVLTIYYCCGSRDGFIAGVPSYGSWDAWDNYDRNQGQSRDYWGGIAPGGGWTGHPLSPENNPSGIAYVPVGGIGGPMITSGRRRPRDVNLVTASDTDLKFLLDSQILATH